jgi:predicted aspartyl protease
MMSRLPLIVLLALASCEASGPCRLSVLATIPFEVVQHHLAVHAEFNHHPSTLVFDTGAQTSVLTDEAVQRLGLTTERALVGTIGGIGGQRAVSIVSSDSFTIKNLNGNGFSFFAANVFGDRPSQFDGILSTDFLSRYDLDLDVPARRIGFYRPSGDCSHPTVALAGDVYAVPLLSGDESDQRPRIEVSIEGKSFRALIDTGAPVSVLFRPAAARLGLTIAALKSDRVGKIGGVGPRPVVAYRHVLQTVTIGDLAVTNMPIAIADEAEPDDEAMLLGLDFISRVHLWISISSARVVMNYPPLPSPFDQHPPP